MKRISVRFALLIAAIGLVWAGHAGDANAHGGVTNEGNMCIMKIGPYRMLFTGYQPERARAEEFCDDIPYEGKAIIVLDHVDTVLREMPTDFRVMKDVKDLGVTAKLEELGNKEEMEAATLLYEEPRLYPRGTKQFEIDLPKGTYIGLVTIADKKADTVHTSVFPFTIGMGFATQVFNYVLIAIGFIVVFGALGVFVMKGNAATDEA